MTTLARSSRAAEKPRSIDVRCSADLPEARGQTAPEAARHDGRCQLFAGHSGPHAVMYAQCGRRVVRTWFRRDRASAVVDVQAIQHLPWMYGYPVPAWFETEAESVG